MSERKVVYNGCYGGFSLSAKAHALYKERTGRDFYEYEDHRQGGNRHDPDLVAVVEQLGEAANTGVSKLKIRTVSGPYRIQEYDGSEWVETPDDVEWV